MELQGRRERYAKDAGRDDRRDGVKDVHLIQDEAARLRISGGRGECEGNRVRIDLFAKRGPRRFAHSVGLRANLNQGIRRSAQSCHVLISQGADGEVRSRRGRNSRGQVQLARGGEALDRVLRAHVWRRRNVDGHKEKVAKIDRVKRQQQNQRHHQGRLDKALPGLARAQFAPAPKHYIPHRSIYFYSVQPGSCWDSVGNFKITLSAIMRQMGLVRTKQTYCLNWYQKLQTIAQFG